MRRPHRKIRAHDDDTHRQTDDGWGENNDDCGHDFETCEVTDAPAQQPPLFFCSRRWKEKCHVISNAYTVRRTVLVCGFPQTAYTLPTIITECYWVLTDRCCGIDEWLRCWFGSDWCAVGDVNCIPYINVVERFLTWPITANTIWNLPETVLLINNTAISCCRVVFSGWQPEAFNESMSISRNIISIFLLQTLRYVSYCRIAIFNNQKTVHFFDYHDSYFLVSVMWYWMLVSWKLSHTKTLCCMESARYKQSISAFKTRSQLRSRPKQTWENWIDYIRAKRGMSVHKDQVTVALFL